MCDYDAYHGGLLEDVVEMDCWQLILAWPKQAGARLRAGLGDEISSSALEETEQSGVDIAMNQLPHSSGVLT